MLLCLKWLNGHNSKALSINGYEPIISKFRKENSSRGGVALFIREGSQFRERPDLDKFIPYTFESTFITLKDLCLTVGVVYRTPSADTSVFLAEYKSTLNLLQQTGDTGFVILGDVYVNLLDYTRDNNVNEFVDISFEHACIPLVTKATRIDRLSASCIDNIITNKIFPRAEAGIIVEDISDHFGIFYSIPHCRPRLPRNIDDRTSHYRQTSKENFKKLNNSLLSCNWDDLTEQDPNVATTKFHKILLNKIDQFCPLKKKPAPRKSNLPTQPWFTIGLRVSSKRKKALYKKSLRKPNKLEFYHIYRNIYNKLVRLAKTNYYAE